MIQSNKSNIDTNVLALIRPSDPLRTCIQSFAIQGYYDLNICSTVYELADCLQTVHSEKITFLISRPAMFGKTTLIDLCHQYPLLQLIGWMGPDESCNDKSFTYAAQAGTILVSSPEQLVKIINMHKKKLIFETACRPSLEKESCNKLDQQAYRLSHEELDALLGAN